MSDAPPAPWKDPRLWLHAVAVLAAACGVVLHQTRFHGWYIEDAAISFAYARNWAYGEGLVPTPGGERVEGYSNFTWVALLAVAEWLGFESFQASKALQYALGALTVPFTWLLAREAAPDARSPAPIFAVGYLALASTFAIWGACGLENALFNFLIAVALWRSSVEMRTGGFPWAAGVWCLLAMTRPEGILYAAVAGGVTLIATTPEPARWRAEPIALVWRPRILQWLALFFVPFGLYHAVRFNYFAYEFPQTYYGKMTTKDPDPLAWNRRGWKYVRDWAFELWTGFFLPLWFLGLLGGRGWRALAALAACAVTGFWLLYPTSESLELAGWSPGWPAPSWWVGSRAYALAFAALTLPLFALGGGRGWKARVLCWAVASAVLYFAVYTLGDWMKAWRWMNLLQVPLAALFGLGVGAIADAIDDGLTLIEPWVSRGWTDGMLWTSLTALVGALALALGGEFALGEAGASGLAVAVPLLALAGGLVSRRVGAPWGVGGWMAATTLLGVAVLPNASHTVRQNGRPETGPFAILTRVDYVRGLLERVDVDPPYVDLDVDMGAHLWWGGRDFQMLDIAGLVDTPFAQHRFERQFVREYVFREKKPHFAHLHGNWAGSSRIPTHPEWRAEYVEVPGYPSGRHALHIGNHLRRDLIMKRAYPEGEARRVAFAGGVVLEGFRLPSEPARARTMWLEVGVRDTTRRAVGEVLTLLVFASRGDALHTWDVPLAHGWLTAIEWRASEIYVGGTVLPIPADLVEGEYDLGFVFIAPDGAVLGAQPDGPLPDGARIGTPDDAAFAVGELVFPGALQVVSLDALSQLAKADRLEAIEHARRGRCAEAEHAWWLSRKHRPIDKRYLDDHGPNVRLQLATCWAWRAEQEPDPTKAAAHLERARGHDHRAPGYLNNKDRVADALFAAGMAARADGDAEAAYRAFSDTLRADPWRAWARRYAEQARAVRLGIDPAVRAARMEDRRLRQEESRKAKARARDQAAEEPVEAGGADGE